MMRGCSSYAIFAFLLIILIIFVIVFWPTLAKLKTEPRSNIRVYFNPPTPIPLSDGGINSTPLPTTIPVSALVSTATIASPPSHDSKEKLLSNQSITVLINDLIGDPISSGKITLCDIKKNFSNGKALFQVADLSICELTASATGYQSKTITVDLQQNRSPAIQLDYFCSFQFCVYQDSRYTSPCPGAEITLYEGLLAPRPLADYTRSFFQRIGFNDAQEVYISRNEGTPIVNRVMPERSFLHSSIETPLGLGLGTPQANDVVEAVGACIWEEQNRFRFNDARSRSALLPLSPVYANKVRIWDALSLSSNNPLTQIFIERVYLIRSSNSFSSFMTFPDKHASARFVQTLKTDNRGFASISGLRPALYFVQAQKEKLYSDIYVIHPSCGGAKLALSETSRVLVRSRLKGIDEIQCQFVADVSDVSVSLISLNPEKKRIYASNSDSRGHSIFDSVPVGKYRINAMPPQGLGLSPLVKDVAINQPNQTIDMIFDYWPQKAIRGKVLQIGSKQPVPNYAVQLYVVKNGTQPASTTKTNVNGVFAFQPLPVGQYIVDRFFSNYDQTLYLPVSAQDADMADYKNLFIFLNRLTPGNISNSYPQNVTVDEENTPEVILWVAPCQETWFSGQVTDEKNHPIANAKLFLYPYHDRDFVTQTRQIDPRTDSQGQFEICLLTKSFPDVSSQQFMGIISAIYGQDIPRRWVETSYGSRQTEDKFIPLASGRSDVKFVIGDRVNNIHIIATHVSNKSIEGQLLTEDGQLPDSAEVFALENDSKIPAKLDSSGHFTIQGISKDRVTLEITRAFIKSDTELSGYTYFLPETVALEFPPDKQLIYLEVTLLKAGYFVGQVKCANHAMIDIDVIALSASGESYRGIINSEGQFMITGLPINDLYTVGVKLYGEKYLEKISDLKPNLTNILFIIQ
ncbi:MAG: carboxypeptidase-like regulatory domain-containing protein [Candidatus Omnitrophota bacterium]